MGTTLAHWCSQQLHPTTDTAIPPTGAVAPLQRGKAQRPCEPERNVKRWHDRDMRKRWTAAGMLAAEQEFRRIVGYRDLARLVIAIERHTSRTAQPPHPHHCHPHSEARNSYSLTVNSPWRPPPKLHADPNILVNLPGSACVARYKGDIVRSLRFTLVF